MARMIDADNLMKSIEDNSYSVSQKNNSIEKGMTLTGIRQCIEEQPTVDAEPVRRGKWVEFGNDIHHCLECSKCGYLQSIYENRPKYCPNCGEKMEEERQNV